MAWKNKAKKFSRCLKIIKETFIVGSLSVPVVVLGELSQMSRRQVTGQMLVYFNTLSLGILNFLCSK